MMTSDASFWAAQKPDLPGCVGGTSSSFHQMKGLLCSACFMTDCCALSMSRAPEYLCGSSQLASEVPMDVLVQQARQQCHFATTCAPGRSPHESLVLLKKLPLLARVTESLHAGVTMFNLHYLASAQTLPLCNALYYTLCIKHCDVAVLSSDWAKRLTWGGGSWGCILQASLALGSCPLSCLPLHLQLRNLSLQHVHLLPQHLHPAAL